MSQPRPFGWTALGALALVLPVLRIAPPPTSVRYRIDQSLTQEVDGSAAGQGKQSISFKTSSFVTVSQRDSAGGRVLRIVVDSMRGDSAAPIPPAVFDSARGSVYHAFVSRQGKPSRIEAIAVTAAAAQVQGLLSDFYPWVRAGFKQGEAWSDTSVTTTRDGADSVTVRRVTNYRAGGPEPKQPKALRITTDHSSQIAGTQPTPQGPAKIEGTGSGKGSYLVSSDGQYLGGEWELTSALRLTASFAPQPVPIALRQSTRVSTIK
jgi:hypothetical protein